MRWIASAYFRLRERCLNVMQEDLRNRKQAAVFSVSG